MDQPATENKKRRLTSSSNHKESPILYLNVGGAKRNIRRSIWNALRDASCGGNTSEDDSSGDEHLGNPLCDLVIKGADHWSGAPTTTDDDGTIRIYLDRNPQVFDDLLEYIEFGQVFLKELTSKNDGGGRLERLKMECDYFTVDALLKDLDEVMFGKAVSFRSNGWFSITGQCVRDEEGEVVSWDWMGTSGNESIAARGRGSGNPLAIICVKTTGTYLMFFSLHSIAGKQLPHGRYFIDENFDDFIRMSTIQEELTASEDGHWTHPLVRCGAFDYRDDMELRRNEPFLYTATFAEPVSLKNGNQIHFRHASGIETFGLNAVHSTVTEHSEFSEEEPHCLNFCTLVRVFGENISKWSPTYARDPNSEHSVIKWMPAQDDLPKTPQWAYLDENDETKIRFRKAGYYLILGRVASNLRKHLNTGTGDSYLGTVRLELRTHGGLPLHIDPEVISYPNDYNDIPSYTKMAEYGPINDVVYAEKDSYISVKSTGGACFVASQFGDGNNIPTQSLSAMRLDHNMRVDRYHVSLDSYNDDVFFKRVLGGEEGVPNQEPLFAVVDGSGSESVSISKLKALEDCCCIVIGCLSCRVGNTVSLYKNDDAIIHSQICDGKGHGYGSHTLNTVVEMKANDVFVIKFGLSESDSDSGGHLAFVKLQ